MLFANAFIRVVAKTKAYILAKQYIYYLSIRTYILIDLFIVFYIKNKTRKKTL